MQKNKRLWLTTLWLLALLQGCDKAAESPRKSAYQLRAVAFEQLPGWNRLDREKLAGFLRAFGHSCQRIAKRPATLPFGQAPHWGTYGHWQLVCQGVSSIISATPQEQKAWLQQTFSAYEVIPGNVGRDQDGTKGLFTGYYEPLLRGALQASERYPVPLRRRPEDLVSIDLGQFRSDLVGIQLAGRVVDGRLHPYWDRRTITEHPLSPDSKQALLWVDNAIDAFFLEIQGSGVIQLEDGRLQRVGYAGQNGHRYTAIGKTLVEMDAMPLEAVNLQSIRQWLSANPDQAAEVMNSNRSYVFFRLLDSNGPLGAEGIELTPRFSMAIDNQYYPYGLPIWIDIEAPESDHARLQQLIVAQDTGGAINGVLRGDYFWGHGEWAEAQAGAMKSRGRMSLLLPRGLPIASSALAPRSSLGPNALATLK